MITHNDVIESEPHRFIADMVSASDLSCPKQIAKFRELFGDKPVTITYALCTCSPAYSKGVVVHAIFWRLFDLELKGRQSQELTPGVETAFAAQIAKS